MLGLICQMIHDTFLMMVGKWQDHKPTEEQKAMHITFTCAIDHDNEQGYRYIEIYIWSPMNYVQVWFREHATVIPLSDMEEQDDEMVPKKGKDYVDSFTEWKKIADHDSCWLDGLSRLLSERLVEKHPRYILGFSGPRPWFHVVKPFQDIAKLNDQ